MISNKIEFYSLLYFSDNENVPNLSRFFKKKKDIIYIKNAFNLSSQIHKQGFRHTLLTNNKKRVLKNIDYRFPLKKIKFKKILNKNTKFFSAHFKVDVLKYLSKQKKISCLLDLDILILKKFSNHFINQLKNYNLLYSQDRESKQVNEINYIMKKVINLEFKKPKWYGGEFISGNANFYKNVYNVIQKIYPKYKKNINSFFHIGDETLLNSAIHYLKFKKKVKYLDLNKKQIIQRHWSTMNDDRAKLLLHLNNIFLHIPSDKFFLSRINAYKFSYSEIRKKYINYHNSLLRKLIIILKIINSYLS